MHEIFYLLIPSVNRKGTVDSYVTGGQNNGILVILQPFLAEDILTSETLTTPIAPRPEGMRIANLLGKIEQGDIKIPIFQRRPSVWTNDQVIDLLDSVLKGYPIGSLLFWLTNTQLYSERNIGDFELPETPEKYPRNYVLDGQQRLTCLYAVLSRAPESLHARFQVLYDLKAKSFIPFVSESNPRYLRLNVLFNTAQFMAKQSEVAQLEDNEALVTEINRLWETFREYVIPVVTIPEAPMEIVGVIFERINSRGTRLTIFDLMVAATWSKIGTQEFDLRDQVDNLLLQLTDKDYEGVEDVTVLRTIAVVKHASARREVILRLREESPEDLKGLINDTQSALASAVDFLSTDLFVKSSDFLPYERQLILLAFLMSRKPSLTNQDTDVLKSWFWRSSLSERYRTGGEALFDEDLSAVLDATTDPSKLERFSYVPNEALFAQAQFRKGAAVAHAYAAMLGSNNPLNMTNGQAIDVGLALSEFNRKEFHHIFPQAYLKGMGVPTEKINCLANICMLSSSENKEIGSQPPSKYFAEYQSKFGDQPFKEIMASNFISDDAIVAALSDDLDGFLLARAATLKDAAANLIK